MYPSLFLKLLIVERTSEFEWNAYDIGNHKDSNLVYLTRIGAYG